MVKYTLCRKRLFAEISPHSLRKCYFMFNRLISIFSRPALFLLLPVLLLLSFSLTASPDNLGDKSSGIEAKAFSLTDSIKQDELSAPSEALSSAAVTVTTGTTTVTTTTATTTTTTTATTTTTVQRFEVCAPKICVGTSANSSFYQERLAVAGDSLALGFNVYGFIPDIHCISGEAVSLWNLDNFTFNMGTGELSMVDAIDYVHPRLLYISVGMNDVNMNYPEPYVKKYREIIDELLKRIPDLNIVVAAITPVCSYCTVVRNDIIREYNEALKKMVSEINSPQVVYFDVYSLVCDENKELREDYTSGDGIHLYIPCYTDILTDLFDFLDTTDFKKQLEG